MAKIPKKIVQEKSTPKKVEAEESKVLPENTGTEAPSKLQSKVEVEKELGGSEKEDVDYLRQYQFKKVNNVPTIGGLLTDPEPGSKAAVMKKFLLSEPAVETLIPLPEGSDPKVPISVTRNGYRLDLPPNTYIKIPRAILEMIKESNNLTVVALSQSKIADVNDLSR